jgi:hypothetical protein
MEIEVKNRIPTEQQIRTSKDNMLCIVPYEELPAAEQAEIDEILQVVNA